MFAHNKQNLELMADMEVLKYTDKRKEYARSIVSVLAHSRNTRPYGRILCMADSSENMRNRIDSIKNADFFKKHKTVIMSVSILLGAALTVMFYPVGFESGNIIDAKGAAAVEKQSSISIGGMNISCKLPWNWTSVNPVIYREEGQPVSDNPLPFGAFETITYLLQDDELIGYIGFSKFEPYTDEIPQEEYHKTVWPYLRLSSFQVWDPFVPVKQTDTGEIGIIDINYMDYDFYDENPGISMAAVPHCESFAIMGYNKEDGVYAAIAFLPDKADRETAAEIIQTMEITCSR